MAFAALCAFLFSQNLSPRSMAAGTKEPAMPSPWGEWVEADFPFFSSIVDARRAGNGMPEDNLTPRALVLNLGHGVWAGFDTELLRVAAIWDGRGVTPVAGAPRSYHSPFNRPRPKGEYPTPDGRVWLANGIYPGWQTGDRFSPADPRERQPSPEEVGRGPLPMATGRFRELRLTRDGVRIEYTVGEARVHEWIRASRRGKERSVERRFRVFPAQHPLLLALAAIPQGDPNRLLVKIVGGAGRKFVELNEEPGVWTVRVAPHSQPLEFIVAMSPDSALPDLESGELPADNEAPAPARWPQVEVTRGVVSSAPDAHVVDAIPLPLDNPWRRLVRLGDIQFFPDGRAAGVTVDGDVWLIDGLDGALEAVRWRRFASGLHEPISLAIREGRIFVFDRNGIWCLHDSNGDDEADVYQMFSNIFTQTADPSDLPNSIKLAPDGTFVIAKGGQRRRTYSRDSGTVLRISGDGRTSTVLGHGFRQPFAGIHPRNGMVIASDQDGYHVPATPLYILDRDRDHGYPQSQTLPQILAKVHLPHEYPASMAEPVVWMPRSVNSSGVSHVWLVDARMGPLNDALVHIGYNRPELLVVRFDGRPPRRQAAVMSLTKDLRFPPLSGSVSPRDKQLYVAGFKLDNTARISDGLARVRHTGAPFLLPLEVVAMAQGFLLRFDVALDSRRAANPENYSVARWNYKRTPNYASPHYQPDGKMGRESITPSSAYLSQDGRSVFVGVPDMRAPIMQMQVSWTLASREGVPAQGDAVLTPYELGRFAPQAAGFGDFEVDLSPPANVRPAVEDPVSITAGARLARSIGCYGCHSTDGSKGIGPSWKGLAGSLRKLKNGDEVVADDAYLRESILHAGARLVEGYEEGMPSFAGIMGETQVKSLILYIQSLTPK